MRGLTIRIVVAVLTFFLGVAATAVWLINRSPVEIEWQKEEVIQKEQELRISLPDSGWEMIFFGSINKRTNEARLPRLRTVLLPDDDLEVRVWVGFGIVGDDALILRRSAGQWSALHLHGMFFGQYPPPKYQETLVVSPPKSGWEKAWDKLVKAGILTLPDASAVNCNTRGLDGTSYVVEINQHKTYRTYMYDNPDYAKCDEAKQMIEIARIISEEFGLGEFEIID